MGGRGWRSWSWLGCPGAVGKPSTGSTPGQGMGQQGLVPPVRLVGCQRVLVPVQEPPARTCWPPVLAVPARMAASAGSRKTTRASPAVVPLAGKVGAQHPASGPTAGWARHSHHLWFAANRTQDVTVILGAFASASSPHSPCPPPSCRSDVRDRHQRVCEKPLPQWGHLPEHQRELPLRLQDRLHRPQLRHRHRRLQAQ